MVEAGPKDYGPSVDRSARSMRLPDDLPVVGLFGGVDVLIGLVFVGVGGGGTAQKGR